MKSTARLIYSKCNLLIVLVIYTFLPLCLMEPFTSTKANITPVKLVHINPNNTLFNTRNDEPVFGSKAKISRVVPMKQVSKIIPTQFKNSSNSKGLFGSYSNVAHKTPVTKVEHLPVPQAHFKALNKNNTKSTSVNKKSSAALYPGSTRRPSSTNSTTVVPKLSKLLNRNNPLFLTSDSWNYLNSAVTDDDLRQIINGLPNQLIHNVTNITKHDPVAGQNFLLRSIINELGNLKRSRMLSLDSENNDSFIPVNKGVRFSAKQRKPVLNVTPLHQKNDLGKPVKNLIKTGVVHWNISGLLNNDESSDKQTPWSSLNGTTEKQSEMKQYRNASSSITTEFKASPIFPTTPSLMQVLSVPERTTFESTTFPPFILKEAKTGFLPVHPTKSAFSKDIKPSSYYDEKVLKSKKDNEIRLTRENSLKMLQSVISEESSKSTITSSRKPRVPPKEDEYALPSLTTSSTTAPEVSKGYQTISESPTTGNKVVWYNHNQTPEDTFYPNFDTFLVPPDEIEILTDLLLPSPEGNSLETKSSFSPFSPSSSEMTFKYDVDSKIKSNKKLRPALHYNSGENGEFGNGNHKGSRFSNEKDDMKKTRKIVPLQQQATTIIDHDHVRDYYGDLDGKNGDSGGRNVYDHNHKGKQYGHTSYNGCNSNDCKHHEIIPRHHQTNRKPSLYKVDDTESYGAFNEDNHYRDSYPPPPPHLGNRHEIGQYRYPSYHDDSPHENVYIKEEPVRIYDDDSADNGHDRDERPTTETTDTVYKKQPKQYSPGWVPHHGDGNNDYHNGHHGYGFFSKAKDYLKKSDFSTAEKWFDITIGVLAFLAFGGYVIMLLYQVFAISQRTTIGTLLGRNVKEAGEMFDLFFVRGPIGQAYLDELETIVKRAMANVKRIWVTNRFAEKSAVPKVKGEVDANK